MDPYLRLANAIIIQAAKDYRVALREMRSYADIEPELLLYEKLLAKKAVKREEEKDRLVQLQEQIVRDILSKQGQLNSDLIKLKRVKADIKEIEDFFHSRLYSILTDVNGDYILDGLRKEVGA